MPNLNMMTGGAGVGSARELAEMLRQMGRGRDKVLAHITPEEADMLIQAGGSGSINPNTGLPEFQPTGDYDFDLGSYEDIQAASPDIYGYGYGQPGEYQAPPAYESSLGAFGAAPMRQTPFMMETGAQEGFRELPFTPRAEPAPAVSSAVAPISQISTRPIAPIEQPNAIERAGQRLEKFAREKPTTARLAGAGTNLLLSGLLARRAGREREAFAQELRQSAAPYAQAQQEALQRAQGGGMTAAQQRAFDIAQARARQGLSAQNLGTGSAAAGIQSGQAARARSLARQESFDEALNLAKIRDSYLREAARQELQADTDLANALVSVLQGEIREATTTQATAPQQTRGRP
jgi:hypothetical protein